VYIAKIKNVIMIASTLSSTANTGCRSRRPPIPFSPEKRALAATLETQRIRLAAHSAKNAKTGIPFFNENLELQTQLLLVQTTTVVEAAARTLAARHSGMDPASGRGR
jgi:hypothetical protein